MIRRLNYTGRRKIPRDLVRISLYRNGGVDEFDVVDSVTQLWFTLVFKRQLGRRLAFKVLRDP